jgi:hypothetical protein
MLTLATHEDQAEDQGRTKGEEQEEVLLRENEEIIFQIGSEYVWIEQFYIVIQEKPKSQEGILNIQ